MTGLNGRTSFALGALVVVFLSFVVGAVVKDGLLSEAAAAWAQGAASVAAIFFAIWLQDRQVRVEQDHRSEKTSDAVAVLSQDVLDLCSSIISVDKARGILESDADIYIDDINYRLDLYKSFDISSFRNGIFDEMIRVISIAGTIRAELGNIDDTNKKANRNSIHLITTLLPELSLIVAEINRKRGHPKTSESPAMATTWDLSKMQSKPGQS